MTQLEIPKTKLGIPNNPEPEDEIEKSLWFRVQQFAHNKLPALIRSPYGLRFVELNQKRDPENNKETCPQSEEEIQLHSLWAAEFYTPTHAEDLASAFINLGWNKEEGLDGVNNPAGWVESVRAHNSTGSWTNLGFLRDSRTSSWRFSQSQVFKLPENIEYASAHMYSHSSSLTCIVVGFVFEKEYRCVYEQVLRRNYKTYGKPKNNGAAIMSPEFQKRDRIAEVREEIRQEAKNWFASNIPGAYCDIDKSNKHFPTCEFITLKNTEPFPREREEENKKRWLNLLGMGDDWNTWKSEKVNGLKFTYPVTRGRGGNFHAAVSASHKNLEKIDLEFYGGHNSSGYVNFLDEKVSELVSRWACLSLIRVHEERLFKIRDSKNYKSSNRKTLKFLKKIQDLVSESLDVSSVTQELIEFSKNKLLFHYDRDTFWSSQTYGKNEPISLTEALSDQIESRSKNLLELDHSLKELIIQQGNLLSASENIKLQRWMRWLTVIITILTSVMVYDALKGKDISLLQLWSDIPGWISTFY